MTRRLAPCAVFCGVTLRLPGRAALSRWDSLTRACAEARFVVTLWPSARARGVRSVGRAADAPDAGSRSLSGRTCISTVGLESSRLTLWTSDGQPCWTPSRSHQRRAAQRRAADRRSSAFRTTRTTERRSPDRELTSAAPEAAAGRAAGREVWSRRPQRDADGPSAHFLSRTYDRRGCGPAPPAWLSRRRLESDRAHAPVRHRRQAPFFFKLSGVVRHA